MGREPPSHLRHVALAGVDVHLVVGVFAVAVDDVFPVECVVFVKRFVRSKAVGIDGERLILMVGEQESNRRFSGGFRRDHVSLSSAAVRDNEYWWLVVAIRATPAWPFIPADTYTSSISTGPASLREGASSALAKRSMRRWIVLCVASISH